MPAAARGRSVAPSMRFAGPVTRPIMALLGPALLASLLLTGCANGVQRSGAQPAVPVTEASGPSTPTTSDAPVASSDTSDPAASRPGRPTTSPPTSRSSDRPAPSPRTDPTSSPAGSSRPTDEPPRRATEQATDLATDQPTDHSTGHSTGEGGPGRRTCTLDDLVVGAAPDVGGAGAGSTALRLGFTNRSADSCWLTGYPGVSFVGDGNGTRLGAAATRAGGGRVVVVRVRPGRSVGASLRIADVGDFDDSTCRLTQADGFRVYPPASRTAVFVAYPAPACAGRTAKQLTIAPVGSTS